jgi:hypothetical protein
VGLKRRPQGRVPGHQIGHGNSQALLVHYGLGLRDQCDDLIGPVKDFLPLVPDCMLRERQYILPPGALKGTNA